MKIINPPIHVQISGCSANINNPIKEAQINFVNCKGITKVVSLNLKACAKHQCDNKPDAPIKVKINN